MPTTNKTRTFVHSIALAKPAGAKLHIFRRDECGEYVLSYTFKSARLSACSIIELDLREAHELAQSLAFLPPLPAVPPAPLVRPDQFPKPAAPAARARGKGRAA